MSGNIKKQWARIRCGNIGRTASKGFKESTCRLCKEESESFQHVWVCREAREKIDRKWVEEVEKRVGTGKEIERNLMELLKGDPIVGICEYS